VGGLVTGVITTAIFVGALGLRPTLVFGLMVLAAVFILVERAFGLRPQRVFRRGWATDLVHFVADHFISLVGIAVVVVVMGTLLRSAMPAGSPTAVHPQPELLHFVGTTLLAEVGGYWGHRAAHRVPFLWRFHKLHHSIAEMDWLASGCVHPIDHAFLRS
jgi:sterol desaturase/sphingolipid hydroxylase (fatty acid hydroxylase superfamily)